ncbi:hypothetical protein [Phenylobacterium sp.]|uniref:hypothetical protein n=1 Tax=Phenylobacterium sp. TaxID=1871053 RepID=UPI00391891AA
MTVATLANPAGFRPAAARIAAAGLAGGALDLAYATVVGATAGRSFQQVWQGVASGWLGKAAYGQGWTSTLLGLLTHFGIAGAMAGAFFLAAGRAPVLRRRPLLSGAIYGVGLYGVMYGLVLPLRWPGVFPRWDGVRSAADILAHVGVGVAIAFVLRGRERSAG